MASLKPGRKPAEVKSYRTISLFSVSFKLLEWVILSRINLYVQNVSPDTQAGFRPNRCTVDQVTLLTDIMENKFEHFRKLASAFINFTAAYDTVWHRGLRMKLAQFIPDKKMVPFTMETIRNRRFKLYTSDGKASRPRTLKNGVPQGFIFALCLFKIFISHIPKTESQQLAYADDLAILCCKPS